MCARDQSSIFSIGGKFRPDYGLLLELHALTLVARSYALLYMIMGRSKVHVYTGFLVHYFTNIYIVSLILQQVMKASLKQCLSIDFFSCYHDIFTM